MSEEKRTKAPAPAETKHPREWAKATNTPSYVYAGAAVLGAHRWIQGVQVTQHEFEETVARFLGLQIGSGSSARKETKR